MSQQPVRHSIFAKAERRSTGLKARLMRHSKAEQAEERIGQAAKLNGKAGTGERSERTEAA